MPAAGTLGTSRLRRTPVGVVLGALAVGALVGCSTADDTAAGSSSGDVAAESTETRTGETQTTGPVAAEDPSDLDRCGPRSAELVAGSTAITTDGAERELLVDLPDGLDPTDPTPVILAFHGSGSDMDQMSLYSRLPALAPERGYVVVTPQGSGEPRGWRFAPSPDDQFVADIMAMLDTAICVDSDRVFAAGISNGSAFASLVACREPYRFRAVAMVAATVPDTCPADVDVAAVAFHGTADRIVPYGGGEIDSEGSNGTTAPDAEPAMQTWAEHNGCDEPPADTPLGDDVVERVWKGCEPGADVRFYRIEGGGHTWPGPIDLAALGMTRMGATTTTIDATEVILDFFDTVS